MKVLAINGSPHEHGCTFTALHIIAEEMAAAGIDVEIAHIGTAPVRGCAACSVCTGTSAGLCVFDDDIANQLIIKMREADGLIIGSPVHFSGIAGTLKSLLDRLFYVNGHLMKDKVGMAVASARRSGGVTTFDQLNHYFTYAQMPLATSCYWNVIHGKTPEQVVQDEEGCQIMRQAGRNMAWLMQSIAAANIAKPRREERVWTNFIRN